MEFQVKFTENLISKYHITEEKPLGSPPETAPQTRVNASHYPFYIAATLSKQNPCPHYVMCYKRVKFVKEVTTANCGNVCCTRFQYYHMAADFRRHERGSRFNKWLRSV
jgi:hypothetical protein